MRRFIAKSELEMAADQTRYNAFKDGVDDSYPLSVDDIAEFHLGYDLHYGAELPARIDGCSNSANKLISISRHITHDTRRRFTVAHEIGHIVLHLPAIVAQAKYQDYFSNFHKSLSRTTDLNFKPTSSRLPYSCLKTS